MRAGSDGSRGEAVQNAGEWLAEGSFFEREVLGDDPQVLADDVGGNLDLLRVRPV